jgi:type II secretory pathway pseudopilin PulG
MRNKSAKPGNEDGMTMIAVMAVMVIFAIALLIVAPTIQQGVQREKELESIRRGEEVADAIKQYVEYYQGKKLPSTIDQLLEGLPYGTKKRQILRPSAAVDPLSEDGKWRLIEPTSQAFLNFARRLQKYNNGLLPSNPSQVFDQFALPLVNIVNIESDGDNKESDEAELEDTSDDVPFIAVASKSRSRSVLTYYGMENHSKWIFTPLFRGSGVVGGSGRGTGAGTGNGSSGNGNIRINIDPANDQ